MQPSWACVTTVMPLAFKVRMSVNIYIYMCVCAVQAEAAAHHIPFKPQSFCLNRRPCAHVGIHCRVFTARKKLCCHYVMCCSEVNAPPHRG